MLNARRPRSILTSGLPLACASLIFVLALVSPVTYAGSDPHFTLLVSQAILQQGTLRLDDYAEEIESQRGQAGYQLGEQNGHLYYNFPVGTPVLAVPVVAGANLLGLDMARVVDNHLVQNLLSALICAAIFLVLYAMGRCYLGRGASLVITLVSVLGSSLISSVGTALWSLDLATFFLAASLLILVRSETRGARLQPIALGLLLFVAFACRPTAALLFALTLIYLWFRSRTAALVVAATWGVGLFLFLGLNWLEYGHLLSSYYAFSLRPSHLLMALYGSGMMVLAVLLLRLRPPLRRRIIVPGAILLLVGVTFWLGLHSWQEASDLAERAGARRLITAWQGALFSPSRGLFVYSPFLLVVVLGALRGFRYWRSMPLAWLAWAWFGMHLLLLAVTNTWHAGFSYGPRVVTDVLPALVLLTFILARPVLTRPRGGLSRGWAAGYVAAGIVAILIHSGQGLWNIHTVMWNAYPSVDEYPRYVFDWRYPQFLITPGTLHERYLAHTIWLSDEGELTIRPYTEGGEITPPSAGEQAVLIGWWQAAEGEWWTETGKAHVLLLLSAVDPSGVYQLEIAAAALDTQAVQVYLNGERLTEFAFGVERTSHELTVCGSRLRPGELNRITLLLPDARYLTQTEVSVFGLRYLPHQLALRDFMLSLSQEPDESC